MPTYKLQSQVKAIAQPPMILSVLSLPTLSDTEY